MPPLGLPRLSIEPVLALPLWLGTLRDHSGYGNHGSNTGGHWGSARGVDGFVNGEVNLNADASLNPADLTIFGWGNIESAAQAQYFAATTDVLTRFYMTATALILTTGGGFSSINLGLTRFRSAAVTATAALAKPSFYINGGAIGLGHAAVALAIGENPWNVAGFTNNAWTNPFSGLLFYPAILTPSEISDLHLWSQQRVTPRKQWPGSGLRYPGRTTDLLVDGDMEEAGVAAWVAGNDADLTKETTDPFEGIQLLRVTRPGATINPYAAQAIMTIGEQYHLMIQVRGDGGTGFPIVYDTAVELGRGTTANVWQSLDVTFVATSTALILLTGAAGAGDYSEWDAAELWTGYTPATGDLMWRANTQSARVSLATETSGRLSNTDFEIITGSYALTESAAGRTITCVTDGRLQPLSNIVGADGWDTSVFEETGGITLTKNAANFTVDMTAGDTFTALELTAP